MSEQGGNWTDGPDPVREHLDKAEDWLALAEGNLRAAAGWLDSAETARSTDTPEADRAMWGAARLAELNLSMAQTINDLTPQRYVLDSTIDVERAVREQITAENADYVAAMEKRLGEQLKADDEAHQAVTLRPGADPEPEAEGELWTTGDGWCYYAVASFRTPDDSEAPRWLLVRHYAQVLRWSSEQGAKPMPLTWAEVGESLTDGDVCGTLRRPTAEERAAFYGPEPDPQPAIEEAHERTTTPPPATLGEAFRTPYGANVDEQVRGNTARDLQELSDREFETLLVLAAEERERRRVENGVELYPAGNWPRPDRGMFRDRG